MLAKSDIQNISKRPISILVNIKFPKILLRRDIQFDSELSATCHSLFSEMPDTDFLYH